MVRHASWLSTWTVVATARTVVLGSVHAIALGDEGNQTSSVTTTTDTSRRLSSTAIVTIAIGVAVVVALLLWLYWLTCKKTKNNKAATSSGGDAFLNDPSSLDKSYEFHDDFGTQYDGIAPGQVRKMPAPGRAQPPYTAFTDERRVTSHGSHSSSASRSSRPSVEPTLYNREVTLSTLRANSDSTRSFLYDVVTPSAETNGERPPKIFASMNSVDFVYPDTDRSNAFSVCSDTLGANDSSRSNASYGFVMESNDSARVFMEEAREDIFDDDGPVPSLRPKEVDSSCQQLRDTYDLDVDTSELTTQQLRQIQVEI